MGPSINWTLNIGDLLVIGGGIYAATRYIVGAIRGLVNRVNLHEEALVAAGWLREKHQGGPLEVPRRLR